MERENALKASPYQRTKGRTGYANGFKERNIQSRVGELVLQIPQTRNVEFYPSCLERGLCLKSYAADQFLFRVTGVVYAEFQT